MAPVLDKVVTLHHERKTLDLLWSVWRAAERDVRDAHRDLNRIPLDNREARLLAYDCLTGALSIEARAQDNLRAGLEA